MTLIIGAGEFRRLHVLDGRDGRLLRRPLPQTDLLEMRLGPWSHPRCPMDDPRTHRLDVARPPVAGRHFPVPGTGQRGVVVSAGDC